MSRFFEVSVLVVLVFFVTVLPSAHAAAKPAGVQAQSVFSAGHANKDGKVNASEMEAIQDKRFKELDTNKDGKLSPEEFVGDKRRASRRWIATVTA